MWSPNLVKGKITKNMQNKPNLTKNKLKHLQHKDLRSVERPEKNKSWLRWPQSTTYARSLPAVPLAGNTQYEKNMQNKPNSPSRIEYRESSIENMQNEPNSPSRIEYRESSIENMQNKPNSPSRIEHQESCIENMQNEPNSHAQTNLSPAITKDYEHARPCESPSVIPSAVEGSVEKNHPALPDSTNIEVVDPPMEGFAYGGINYH
jgi:hypothetical protein